MPVLGKCPLWEVPVLGSALHPWNYRDCKSNNGGFLIGWKRKGRSVISEQSYNIKSRDVNSLGEFRLERMGGEAKRTFFASLRFAERRKKNFRFASLSPRAMKIHRRRIFSPRFRRDFSRENVRPGRLFWVQYFIKNLNLGQANFKSLQIFNKFQREILQSEHKATSKRSQSDKKGQFLLSKTELV